MSIATSIQRAAASARPNRVHTVSVESDAPSIEAQLRDMRALLRHFVLAFAGAAAAIYVIVASGLTI